MKYLTKKIGVRKGGARPTPGSTYASGFTLCQSAPLTPATLHLDKEPDAGTSASLAMQLTVERKSRFVVTLVICVCPLYFVTGRRSARHVELAKAYPVRFMTRFF